MIDDLLHALRGLARAKGLSAVLLISLALGTGVNATVFTAAHGLLFRAPAGVAEPSDLANIYTSGLDGSTFGPSSFPDFGSIASSTAVFSVVAALYEDSASNVVFAGESHEARIAAVSEAFFDVLGMNASRGRLPAAADPAATPPRAVISRALWMALGAPEQIVDRTVRIADRDHVVVGIAPDGFRGLRAGRPIDVWVPLSSAAAQSGRGDRRLSIIGRLREGATIEDAQHDLQQLSEQLASEHPATNRGTQRNPGEARSFTAIAYSKLDPDTRQQTAVVAGVIAATVVLLLASACVNAGSLLLSRALARRREIAVKMALGATRRRVMQQVLLETLVVTVAGAVLGLLFAFWTGKVVPSFFAPEHAAMLDTTPGVRTILAAVVVAALAGALFGSVPAVQGTSESPAMALRGDSGEVSEKPGGINWRAGLVVIQLAVSVVLLIATGVLAASLARALEGDFGFLARNVAVFTVKTPATFDNHQRAVQAIRAAGQTHDVSWAAAPPLTSGALRQFQIEGNGSDGVVDAVEMNVNVVSPRYFAAMQLPPVEGRLFNAADHGLADTVVVVDEALAVRYFAGSAVGRTLIDAEGKRAEIVGVVRSGRYRTLQEPPPPTVYYSTTQIYLARGHILFRTSSDPTPMLDDLARRLGNAGFAVERTSTLEGRLSDAVALDRLVAALVAVCGLLALGMALIGVYGIINDAVRRRTREIGLRVALGAGRIQVVRLVAAEALYLTAAGMAAGIIAAVAISRAAAMFVYDLPRLDPYALVAMPGMLAAVVAVASVLPLRRALRVSPTIALRAQ
jgi:predicted permease